MKIKYIILFFCFLAPFLMKAQQTSSILGKTAYPFLVSVPKDHHKSPVFIFLHGRSLSGTDLNRVKRYGVLYAMNKGQEVPGIVVAPQSTGGWDPDKVMEIVDYVIENYNADRSRIYVCGMSMGGYGTMDVAGKYPDRIAAAVAICGGGNTKLADNLAEVPIWLQHGTADRAVPVSESRKIFKAIKQADPNANVKLSEIKGGTHGSVERIFHTDSIYQWMLSHQKKHSS